MKNLYLVFIFLFGAIFVIIGAVLKIQDYATIANALLVAGMAVSVFAVVLLIWKYRHWLNK